MWAFSDESERAATMWLGVLFVPLGRVHAARRELRSLLLAGQRRVHTAKESPRRRRIVVDAVAALDLTAVVFNVRRAAGRERAAARGQLLAAAAVEVASVAAGRWVLDHQDPAQAARDRRTIAAALGEHRSTVVYDHQSAHDEPLLWAVDALVWAVGAGGEWRRRVERIVEQRPLGL